MTENADLMTATPTNQARSYVEPDLLSESLALLRIRGQVGSRTEARGSWGLQLPASDSYFHVIERGSCWLQVEGDGPPVHLEIGDAVILPHGHAHRLTDAPAGKVISLTAALASQSDGVVSLGGAGPTTSIVCGAFRFDGGPGHPLLEALPPLLHVHSLHAPAGHYEEMAQRFLIHEVNHPHLGAEAVVSRLVELLFVQTVRGWINSQPSGTKGWLVALRHPVLKTALHCIHTSTARPWTVSDLASQAGVSKSALATLFRQIVGKSPMAYLARW